MTSLYKTSLFTEKPVEFLAPLPTEQKAIPGDEITLEVELSKDTEDVFWLKDGKKIKPSDNVKIVKDGKKHKLIIKKVDFDDDAVYSFNTGDQKCECNLNVSGMSAANLLTYHQTVIDCTCVINVDIYYVLNESSPTNFCILSYQH